MNWLFSLFCKLKKYEKTIQIINHNDVIGVANDIVFKQLPSSEYFINFIEFWIPELILDNDIKVFNLFYCLERGNQHIPFDILIKETNKKTISIVGATIQDFGKFVKNDSHIIFENVTLIAKTIHDWK